MTHMPLAYVHAVHVLVVLLRDDKMKMKLAQEPECVQRDPEYENFALKIIVFLAY
jgi:hypothetical protein